MSAATAVAGGGRLQGPGAGRWARFPADPRSDSLLRGVVEPREAERAMRILLADDHTLFAEAFKTLIERDSAGTTVEIQPDLAGAHAALAAGPSYDLVLLDLTMPGMDGGAGVARTLRAFPGSRVVVISGTADPADARAALQQGARGFLPKTLPGKVIFAALRLVASGGTYLPPEYAIAAAAAPPPAGPGERPPAGLTPREAEVLRWLATGKSNKEIGRALGLQEITIKLHVRNIFRKLGVRNRVEAANAAARLPGLAAGPPP
jgi:DNA-binding NarL/FixJ family response regulator